MEEWVGWVGLKGHEAVVEVEHWEWKGKRQEWVGSSSRKLVGSTGSRRWVRSNWTVDSSRSWGMSSRSNSW